MLHRSLTTDSTGQSNKTEGRAWKTTTVVPRAVESCPGELDSVSASVPNAKEVKNPNSVQAVINCIFFVCLEQSTEHLRFELWEHGAIPTVMDSAEASSRTKRG